MQGLVHRQPSTVNLIPLAGSTLRVDNGQRSTVTESTPRRAIEATAMQGLVHRQPVHRQPHSGNCDNTLKNTCWSPPFGESNVAMPRIDTGAVVPGSPGK